MNIEQFEVHLDSFGGQLEDWPAEVRLQADQLLAKSIEAQVLLDQQREIEALLDEAMIVPRPFGLAQRIIERAKQHPLSWLANLEMNFVWKPAFASVLALTAGMYLGSIDQDLHADIDSELTNISYYDIESWEYNDEP